MPVLCYTALCMWLVALFLAQALLAAYAYTMRHSPVLLAFSVVAFACGATMALSGVVRQLRAAVAVRMATAAVHVAFSAWLVVWQNLVSVEGKMRAVLLAISAVALVTALSMGTAVPGVADGETLPRDRPRVVSDATVRSDRTDSGDTVKSEATEASAKTDTNRSDSTVRVTEKGKLGRPAHRQLEHPPAQLSLAQLSPQYPQCTLPGLASPLHLTHKIGMSTDLTAPQTALSNKASEHTLVEKGDDDLLWLVAASMAPCAWYDSDENWMAPRTAIGRSHTTGALGAKRAPRTPTAARAAPDLAPDFAAMRSNFEDDDLPRKRAPRRSLDSAPSTILEHSDEADAADAADLQIARAPPRWGRTVSLREWEDHAGWGAWPEPRPLLYQDHGVRYSHAHGSSGDSYVISDSYGDSLKIPGDCRGGFGHSGSNSGFSSGASGFHSGASGFHSGATLENSLRAVQSASAAPSLHTYREATAPASPRPSTPRTPLSRPSTPLAAAPSTSPGTSHSSPIKKVMGIFRALLTLPQKTHRQLASVATAVSFSTSMASGRSSRLGSPRKVLKALFVRDPRDARTVAVQPAPAPPKLLLPAFDDNWDAQTAGALDRLRVSSLPASVVGEYDKEKWRTLKELERRAALAASLPSCT